MINDDDFAYHHDNYLDDRSGANEPEPEVCDFCDIDGMGNHAPRCPIPLEARIQELETALDAIAAALRGHGDVVEKAVLVARAALKKVVYKA